MRESRRKLRRRVGATLLEVLISTAILAVGMAATMRAIGTCARTQSQLEDRTTARRLAEQEIATLRVQSTADSPADMTGQFEEPFEEYSWTAKTQRAGDESPFALVELTVWKEDGSERNPMYSTQTLISQ